MGDKESICGVAESKPITWHGRDGAPFFVAAIDGGRLVVGVDSEDGVNYAYLVQRVKGEDGKSVVPYKVSQVAIKDGEVVIEAVATGGNYPTNRSVCAIASVIKQVVHQEPKMAKYPVQEVAEELADVLLERYRPSVRQKPSDDNAA